MFSPNYVVPHFFSLGRSYTLQPQLNLTCAMNIKSELLLYPNRSLVVPG